MRWFWFSLAVLATSVVVVVAAVFFFPPARIALASTFGGGWPAGAGPWARAGHGGPFGSTAGFALPPQLQGLVDIPANERFQHFLGAEVKLTDKDNQPLAVTVIPGKVTSSSATSLTIAANDGSSPTFGLNDKTMMHIPAGANGTTLALANGDSVVVVTLNHNTTATAVIAMGAGGPGWFGPGGPWGAWHQSH